MENFREQPTAMKESKLWEVEISSPRLMYDPIAMQIVEEARRFLDNEISIAELEFRIHQIEDYPEVTIEMRRENRKIILISKDGEKR